MATSMTAYTNNTISQIQINGTTYDITDATTRNTVSNIDERVTQLETSVVKQGITPPSIDTSEEWAKQGSGWCDISGTMAANYNNGWPNGGIIFQVLDPGRLGDMVVAQLLFHYASLYYRRSSTEGFEPWTPIYTEPVTLTATMNTSACDTTSKLSLRRSGKNIFGNFWIKVKGSTNTYTTTPALFTGLPKNTVGEPFTIGIGKKDNSTAVYIPSVTDNGEFKIQTREENIAANGVIQGRFMYMS